MNKKVLSERLKGNNKKQKNINYIMLCVKTYITIKND
ncbi:hypothetical protein MACK_004165 (apicoplast) [Theileria orientalis]|uniref:Uncharacterized protein n=1 Tax=Theileria orientalis TaxID=68886 RepID=A0A976SI43_THEOR|nr:hypothetical protein MACK_004165 [Theileria orientalis]